MKLTDVLATPTTNHNRYNVFESHDDSEIVSYTNEGYIFLESMYQDFNLYKRQLYVAVAESDGSQQVITESFSDFFIKLKDLIVKFLNFIKTIFNKFILNINRLVRSDKYIRSHKKDLYLFGKENQFDYTGYKYSIDGRVPVINVVQSLDTDFIKVNSITLTEPTSGEDSIATKIKAIDDELTRKVHGDYYDVIRGKVIGKTDGSKIKAANYSKKLFKVYRSNKSEKFTFTVDANIVLDSYKTFENYKEKLDTVKETKERIEEEYEDIKQKLEDMYETKTSADGTSTINFLHGTGGENGLPSTANLSIDNINALDSYFKKLSDVITTVSTIHTNAYTAKMDALKEEFLQSKAILYKSLSKVVKNRRKE